MIKRLAFAIALGMLALSACTASVSVYDPDGYYDRQGHYHRY